MKNKVKMRKWALLAVSALLLVCVSVGATVAYLTAQDTVTNTFTVGKVAITLDEAKVNADGTAVTPAERVKENSYKLLPGHTYTKDPTVHVAAGSEDCWVFVKLENGIDKYEAATTEDGYKTISDQITANGWTALDGVTGVYYKNYTSNIADVDMVVFNQFKTADNAESVEGWQSAANAKVTVTAYAVQADGFDTANAAWDAAKFEN